MKHLVLYLNFSIIFLSTSAQRVISNCSLGDIDDANSFMDTATVNHGYHILDLYNCQGNEFNKDSCVHFARQKYDNSGKLIELIKGDNLTKKKIDYYIQYTKLSDSTYETVVKYPPGSTMIPDLLYVDTVIKGKSQHISLYKKDKEGNIVMRSIYYNKHYEVKIERYDLDNSLQQIYYPLGNSEPKSEWLDSVVTNRGKTVTYHAIFPENEYTSGSIFDPHERLLETFYENKRFENIDEGAQKTMYIYDTAAHPIIKITLDNSNRFISEERFYYKGKVVVRYTMDYDIFDNDVNVEKIWNDRGSLIIERSRPSNLSQTGTETTWKYFYRKDGLTERAELYKNGNYKATKFYKYQ